MAAYEFNAIDQNGQHHKGILEGDSPRLIRQKLREQGLIPTSISLITHASKTTSFIKFSYSSISSDDLALITRQLATLLSASLPVDEALASVAEQAEKSSIKKVIAAVHAKVLEGNSLAQAFGTFPKIFSPLYKATVAAGEQTGHLDKVMDRLAEYTEQQHFIKQKIQQALIYPIVMCIISFSIVTFLLIYVVPNIVNVFGNTGQELPLVTKILLAVSYGFKSYGFIILGILIIFYFLWRRLLKIEAFRYNYEIFLLKLPIIGKLIKINNTARFSRTLGILVTAGVPILEALHISTDVISALPIRAKVNEAATHVKEGSSIHHALKQTGYFTPMSIYLIASGEASGQLENMLERSAHYQEQEINRMIEITLALFEPLLIIVMGGIVLFIVLAILLPIFSLSTLVS